jgi:hypothetical protein
MENVTPADEARWLLAGVQREKEQVQARLDYLERQEKTLTDRAMTGTPTTVATTAATGRGKATVATTGSKGTVKAAGPIQQRRRPPSEAQRKKMSAAATKRWKIRKKEKAERAAAEAAAVAAKAEITAPATEGAIPPLPETVNA